jgi:hypothetical protein
MADIRELVTSTLDDLGFGDAKPLGQRLLHRDRFFVGVRFEFEGISAIWLTDTDYLRIIDGTGKLLKLVGPGAAQEAARKVA